MAPRVAAAVALIALSACARGDFEPAARAPDPALEPLQERTQIAPFSLETRRGPVRLIPRARFAVDAVVVGREAYWLDASAFLSPVDLALAWGRFADPAARDGVSFRQSARFCLWRTRRRDLDLDELGRHVANVHVIPATPNLRRLVRGLDSGEAVALEGLLVDVEGEDGFRWSTSLSRRDDGAGSCEVLWLTAATVDDRTYR